MKNCWI